MSKKKFDYEIINIIGILEENENSNWCRVLMKVSWDGNPPVLDIRKVDMSTYDEETGHIKMGNGISLSDEGLLELASLLLQNGYLNKDECEEYFDKEDSIFKKKSKRKLKINRKE